MSIKNSVRSGDVGELKRLIDDGGDLNEIDQEGYRPIHYAVWENQIESLKILLGSGVDVTAKDGDGGTVLHLLAWASLEMSALLIDEFDDVNIQQSDGITPLHTASFENNVELVKLLLERGAMTDIKNEDDETPLDVAIREGNDHVASLLKENSRNEGDTSGADPN